MRGLFLAGLLLYGHQALAQQLPAQPPVTLSVEVRDAMLVVETLKAIGCPSVQQLIVCQQAVDLIRKIQDQVKAQEKVQGR
jgi:hypothetical protein